MWGRKMEIDTANKAKKEIFDHQMRGIGCAKITDRTHVK